MSELPWLSLYTDKFLADTGHLNAQETGAYLLLMIAAWRSPGCVLPNDDARLARWARMDARTFRRIKQRVLELWTHESEGWVLQWLRESREHASKRAEQSRLNGKQSKGAKPLKSHDPPNPAGSSWDTQTEPNTRSQSQKSSNNNAAPARAREEKFFSKEAEIFACDLARIAGHDPEFLPPVWLSGSPIMIVQMWLNMGWQVEIMRAAAIGRMAMRRGKPINSPRYFEGVFKDAHEPQMRFAGKPQEVPHVQGSRSGHTGGRAGPTLAEIAVAGHRARTAGGT